LSVRLPDLFAEDRDVEAAEIGGGGVGQSELEAAEEVANAGDAHRCGRGRDDADAAHALDVDAGREEARDDPGGIEARVDGAPACAAREAGDSLEEEAGAAAALEDVAPFAVALREVDLEIVD